VRGAPGLQKSTIPLPSQQTSPRLNLQAWSQVDPLLVPLRKPHTKVLLQWAVRFGLALQVLATLVELLVVALALEDLPLGSQEVEEEGMTTPNLGEMKHIEGLVPLTFPKHHCETLDSQVADGQVPLADHEHCGRSSSCAASSRDRNDRTGTHNHSGICPSRGSSNDCRALQSVQEIPTKADLSDSQELLN